MRINNPYLNSVDVDATNSANQIGQAVTSSSPAKSLKDKEETVTVSISSKASELSKTASYDEAKVSRLRQLVEKGALPIDVKTLAERMVGHHLDYVP